MFPMTITHVHTYLSGHTSIFSFSHMVTIAVDHKLILVVILPIQFSSLYSLNKHLSGKHLVTRQTYIHSANIYWAPGTV